MAVYNVDTVYTINSVSCKKPQSKKNALYFLRILMYLIVTLLEKKYYANSQVNSMTAIFIRKLVAVNFLVGTQPRNELFGVQVLKSNKSI